MSFVLPAVQVQLFKVTSYVTSFSRLILTISSRSILPLIIDPEDPDPRIDLYSEYDEIFFFFLFFLLFNISCPIVNEHVEEEEEEEEKRSSSSSSSFSFSSSSSLFLSPLPSLFSFFSFSRQKRINSCGENETST